MPADDLGTLGSRQHARKNIAAYSDMPRYATTVARNGWRASYAPSPLRKRTPAAWQSPAAAAPRHRRCGRPLTSPLSCAITASPWPQARCPSTQTSRPPSLELAEQALRVRPRSRLRARSRHRAPPPAQPSASGPVTTSTLVAPSCASARAALPRQRRVLLQRRPPAARAAPAPPPNSRWRSRHRARGRSRRRRRPG